MVAVEGWYDDGQRPGKYRWWDGQKWTGFYSDVQAVIDRGEQPLAGESPPPPTSVSETRTPPTPPISALAAPVPVAPVSTAQSLPGPPRPPSAPIHANAIRGLPLEYRFISSAGWPNVEVAGESHHEAEIVAALGRRPRIDEEVELTVDAVLVPEPDNPFDANAISVRISGKVVGYLERDAAPLYKPHIDRITASGHIPVTSARLWAVMRRSWDDTANRLHSNVRLSLAEPHLLIPRNDPPAESYSVVPWGSGLQVLGEDKHFDVLAPHVTDEGRGLLLVTLHRVTIPKGRATAEIVEVRVDGRRAGQMSGVSSMHFLPIVDHLEVKGLTAAAWSHIKGSGLAAELVLQAAKAAELTPEWLNGVPVTVPRLIARSARYAVPNAYGNVRQPEPHKRAGLGDRLRRGLR